MVTTHNQARCELISQLNCTALALVQLSQSGEWGVNWQYIRKPKRHHCVIHTSIKLLLIDHFTCQRHLLGK